MADGAASPNTRPYLDPRALLSDEARDRLQDADEIQFVLDHIARDPSDIPQGKDLGNFVKCIRAFYRTFKDVVGRPYKQVTKEYRLALALFLLSIRGWTVEKCAGHLSYSSRASFRPLLRQELGRPPSTFRQEEQPVSKGTLERIIKRIAAGRPFRDLV